MALMSPHTLDESYDEALSRVALAGGLAALPQLGELLGDGRMRSLVRAVERHGFGARRPLPGAAPTKALALTTGTIERLLGRRGGRVRPSEVGMVRCVQRFGWHLRTGRPLSPPGWVVERVIGGARRRLRGDLERLGETIRRLKTDGDTRGATTRYESWQRDRQTYDRLSQPEAAEAFSAATRIRGLYIAPAPPIFAFVDRETGPAGWRRVLRAVSTVALDLGDRLPLHVLVGSPYQADLARRALDRALADPSEGVLPDRVTVEVIDLDTARFFVHPVELPGLLTPADRDRLGRLDALFGGGA